ncbi:MAG: alpha amylase N-terminal ig-like domain-containing protein [Firmicutes bacterium]|nr:alpha amylase N-terminal ig-like domain-containing protein [Bacillota bacterium]
MNSFATHAGRRCLNSLGRRNSLALMLAILLAAALPILPLPAAGAAQAASIHAVLAGNLQTELGAPGDWDPANNTTLMKDPNADGIYTFMGFVPAGNWEYKVALNGNWTESYPASNVTLSVPAGGLTVTFRYNAATHAVEDSVNNPGLLAVVAGSFQSELGAAGDWNPADTTTRLSDPDGDGLYTFTANIPAGAWEYKVALGGAWNESYPGMNRILTVPAGGRQVTFLYFSKSHVVKDSFNDPDVVTAVVASDVQQELGAASDWNPADMTTQMTDSDGDGVYTYQADLPKGSWQYKVALHGAWSESYPGSNVVLNVPADGTMVIFTYDAKTHVVKDSINNPAVASHDNDIWWNELKHDSRQALYRSPFGAVPTGQPVTLRVQTARGDLTGAQVRVWDQIQAREEIYSMQPAGTDPDGRFDYWQAVIPARTQPTILWYRFTLVDGTRRAYYGDDSSRDGGVGAVTDYPTDYDYQITVYQAGFTTPNWMKNSVVYQIFPDRFNNGDPTNDPKPSDPDVHGWPVVFKQWNDLPEQPPHGRDFFGGDLEGVISKLDYLQSLGIKAIYFNPIFQAASNHLYDTTDYKTIDPYFGDLATFQRLAAEAGKRGIRLILDGVFNHTGSDSLYFDKYSRYNTLGAYESQSSPYFDWYTFRLWPNDYESWWNFDTLPKLRTDNPAVQNFIFGAPDSVARYWLNQGSNGWRLDVANEVAHPFWQKFRPAVKATQPDAVIIGELWEDASSWLLGDEFDSTMNYRFRNAVLGFFADGTLDAGAFNNTLEAIREDYPAEAFYAAMNLVDSHDTARILRQLHEDKALLKLVAIFQMTYPGAPTIYYGDEAGITGGSDPDSRRTFPWGGRGPGPSGPLSEARRAPQRQPGLADRQH